MSKLTDAEVVEAYQRIKDALESEGHEVSVRPAYSGRGMYGATCPAIVSDCGGVVLGAAIASVLYDLGQEELIDELLPQRVDQMGRDAHVYY